MAGETTGGPETLPPEVQEKLARLEKLEKEHATLGYRVRAWEKIDKELGDVLERDQYGNPVRLKVGEDGDPDPVPVSSGNPWGPISTYVPEFNPQSAETYLTQQVKALLNQQGFVTTAQAQQLMQQAAQIANGNNAVWRMHDRLTMQEAYKDLSNSKSKLYERTAKILQDRRLGVPLQADPVTGEPLQGAVPFDRWQYRDLESLRLGADLAAMELSKEAVADGASKAAAEAAQGAGDLSPAPGTTTGAAPAGKPDFTTMKTPDEIVAALDAAMQTGATAG